VKINEIEALVGITKKNIRFYEEQGLLSPKRNLENGYRVYCEEEVEALKRIKLLRKLGVPIEEIRQMFNGTHTVGDGIRRHLVTLAREKRNLEQSILLCQQLQSLDIPADDLDVEIILAQMEDMEKGGTSFSNKQNEDVRIRYVAPVIVTILMVALMLSLIGLIVWAYCVSPEDAPPLWFMFTFIGAFIAMAGGTIFALIQRVREIRKGEIDDAKRY